MDGQTDEWRVNRWKDGWMGGMSIRVQIYDTELKAYRDNGMRIYREKVLGYY